MTKLVREMQASLEALAGDGETVLVDDSDEQRQAIGQLEAKLERPFDPVTRAYLQFAPRGPSGQTARLDVEWTHWDHWTALSLSKMWEERSVTLQCFQSDEGIEADPGVRARWFHRGWLPIAEDGGGNLLCVDLDPAPGGCAGQIIEFRHDDQARPREAANLLEFLAEARVRREAGDETEDEEPALPTLTLRFFVDGDPCAATLALYQEPNPAAIVTGVTPLVLQVPPGLYSVRFEHEGRAHWRREVQVWQPDHQLDFHW